MAGANKRSLQQSPAHLVRFAETLISDNLEVIEREFRVLGLESEVGKVYEKLIGSPTLLGLSPWQVRAGFGRAKERRGFARKTASFVARDELRRMASRRRHEIPLADLADSNEAFERLSEGEAAVDPSAKWDEEIRENRELDLIERARARLAEHVPAQARSKLKRNVLIHDLYYEGKGNKAIAKQFGLVSGRVTQIKDQVDGWIRQVVDMLARADSNPVRERL